MTKQEFLELFKDRQIALKAMKTHADGLRFRQANEAIVAELCRRRGPVELPGVTLHLTADRLNFLPLKPGTRKVVYGQSRRDDLMVERLLYDYSGKPARTA